MSTLTQGSPAPDFDLPADGGSRIKLSELKGRKVVLYFYPKDNTSGCTLEAIDFSARKADFDAAGTIVIGVSPDSVKSHDSFKKKHDLSIRGRQALADPQRGRDLADHRFGGIGRPGFAPAVLP